MKHTLPGRAFTVVPTFVIALGCLTGQNTCVVEEPDVDGDGFTADVDCDDANPTVNPDAEELCDGIDNDCDFAADEGLQSAYYLDGDQDGYGLADAAISACEAPEGYTAIDGDCDDDDASAHPGATEVCDGIDDDCDGLVDTDDPSADPSTCGPVCGNGHLDAGERCDDGNTLDGDGCDQFCAPESCGDGVVTAGEECDDGNDASDDGCSSCTIDEGYACSNSINLNTGSDGQGGQLPLGSEDPRWQWSASPEGPWLPSGVLTECVAAWADAPDNAQWVSRSQCSTPANVTTYYRAQFNIPTEEAAAATTLSGTVWADDLIVGVTLNGQAAPVPDGSGFNGSGAQFGAWPSSLYQAGLNEMIIAVANGPLYKFTPDGLLVSVPDAFATGSQCAPVGPCGGVGEEATYYPDLDEDGYGDPSEAVVACEPPAGFVANDLDCDDSDPETRPGTFETCDGRDNDCDGEVDEVGAAGEETFYPDADGDGYGALTGAVSACSAPEGYVLFPIDCDDTRSSVNPDAQEICDGLDNDCDGGVDTDDASVDLSTCGPVCGNGHVEAGERCDDGNTFDGDGCDQFCALESCGDGVITAGEECDDANDISDDGCSSCTIDEGYTCSNSVNLNTGSDGQGGRLPLGSEDPRWQWSASPVGPWSPSRVLTECVAAWADAPANAQWVSRSQCSTPSNTTTYYRAQFNIPTEEAAAATTLSGTVWADDLIVGVTLNGQTAPVPDGSGFNGSGAQFGAWPSSLYQAGLNEMIIAVANGPTNKFSPDGLLVSVPGAFAVGSQCVPQ